MVFDSSFPNSSKIQTLSVVLADADGNMIIFSNEIDSFPNCTKVQTLDELYNYSDTFKDEALYCYNFMSYRFKVDDFQNITLKNDIKILINDGIKDDKYTYYATYEAEAIVTYNGKILGIISYISPHQKKDKFLALLQTVKLKQNVKSIEEYIKLANEYIRKKITNLALKNAVSALLLDKTNKEAKSLLQKIFTYQKEIIEVNEGDLKRLE
jgi:hypothetical protein